VTHKWLTEKEVDGIYDDFEQMRDRDLVMLGNSHGAPSQLSDTNRLIADWREMRELLLSCEDQLPACTRDREDIEDMREATADD